MSDDDSFIPADYKYWCSRCGWYRVSKIGKICGNCMSQQKMYDEMWENLKCGVCGKQAVGFNINGAFCSDAHFPWSNTNSIKFEGEGVVGMALPISEGKPLD